MSARRSVVRVIVAGLLLALAGVVAFVGTRVGSGSFLRVVRAPLPPGDFTPRPRPTPRGDEQAILRLREQAFPRAGVYRAPLEAIERAELGRNVDDDFTPESEVSCAYRFGASHGYSPKFDCVLPGGEIVRVKYGERNAEVFGEVAATRLLSALGFGADRVSVVRSVRCFGCPLYPYPRLGPWWNLLLPARGGYRAFDVATVERPARGTPLATTSHKGWSWWELDRIDPGRGGASAAEKDAFRMIAVFLAHWDNKGENQRLVCLDDPAAAEDGCAQPFAMIQDAGSTFGPEKLNLARWRETPVWADRSACRVSMRSLPYQGGTFPDAVISEAGRRFIAEKLTALSRAQVRELFSGARFALYSRASAEGRDVERWTDAFLERVRQVADGAPCPDPVH